MSEWPVIPLGDLIHVKHGFAFKGASFSETGTEIVLTPGNFKIGGGLQLRPGKEKYYTASYPEEFRLRPGDLLVVMTDLTQDAPILGSPAVVPAGHTYLHNQRLGLVTVQAPDRLDARFLYWLLAADRTRAQLRSTATGATVRHTAPERIYRAGVPLPSLTIQRRIAEILGAIDDLIENNRRRIALLDWLAQAIYREWFVHFRYPGHEDDELVDSPLGPIPAGWDVRPLFEEAEVSFGFALKSKGFGSDGKRPVIRIRDVPNGLTPTFTDEFPGDRYVVEDGDTLIGMDGDFHMCRWSGGTALLNQRVTRVRPTGTLGAEALYWALRSPIREWNERIVGTTVAHLGKRHLEEISLAIPQGERVIAMNASLDPIGDLGIALKRSSRSLAGLRDELLPKLVTGAIDVSHLDLDALLEAPAA